jgi:maleate isomerase
MAYTSWRGVVGNIKPTMRPGSVEELCKMLPEGIGLIPLFLDARRGTVDEFKVIIQNYEEKIRELAEQEVDMIHPEGAPPFMVQGYKGEQGLIKQWEKKFKIPVFTSGTNHIRALKALKVKKIYGASYFPGKINDIFAKYFLDAGEGFQVLSMEGIQVEFDKVGQLSPQEVYAHIKKGFLACKSRPDGIYMLGSGWRTLDIVDTLEKDLGVPVVHPVPARCWEIQKRLTVNQKIPGFGRLLAEMLPG